VSVDRVGNGASRISLGNETLQETEEHHRWESASKRSLARKGLFGERDRHVVRLLREAALIVGYGDAVEFAGGLVHR
jgi:hypothetical protein